MKKLLTILWVTLPLCWILNSIIAWVYGNVYVKGIHLAIAILFFSCWIYLTWRCAGFKKRLFHFLRLLLSGDYETGIRTKDHFIDEISSLENLANDVSERLRIYDRLRADRVSVHSRALNLLLQRAKEGQILAHIEKGTFTINPAAQQTLSIQRNNFSFESVLQASENEAFRTLFEQVIEKKKVNTEGKCHLQLPGMQQPIPLSLLFLPLRDRDEVVTFAIIIIE